MKGQNSNRILPIKSLLQNLKQQSKKQYLQLDNKNQSIHFPQNSVNRMVNQTNVPLTQREHPSQDSSLTYTPRDHHKGISLNKQSSKNTNHHAVRQSTPATQFVYPSFHHSKKEKSNFQTSARFNVLNQDPLKIQQQTEHYYTNNKINKSEQHFYPHFKQQIKDLLKNPQNRLSEEFDKDSFTLTDKMNSKFEEQTRYFSKMQSQPIFKDQLTKIKTELFQKQALLFQKAQEIEEKDKVIVILQRKLQAFEYGKNKQKGNKEKDLLETVQNLKKQNVQKQKRLLQYADRANILQEKIKKQVEQIIHLKAQLERSAEEYSKYQQDNVNSFMLYSLKIRQYEAEQKQRIHQVQEIKEKEKRTIQHQQKVIKGLNQVLRQKEEIICQLTSKCSSLQNQMQKMRQKDEGALGQVQHKEMFIRQLSAEVGDLKSNLRNMQLRIRQMIEEQEELKRTMEDQSQQNLKLLLQIDLQQAKAKQSATQKDQLISLHRVQREQTEKTIYTFKQQLIALQKSQNKLIQSKLCLENDLKEANKKLDESKDLQKLKQTFHQANVGDLKMKIGELNEIIFKRQNSLIAYKEKSLDLQEKLKKATQTPRITPPKINPSKLIKDNQRLNIIIKDFDSRLYQSLKLNQSLNQQISKRQLIMLNRSLCSRFQKDIE